MNDTKLKLNQSEYSADGAVRLSQQKMELHRFGYLEVLRRVDRVDDVATALAVVIGVPLKESGGQRPNAFSLAP